MNLEDWGQVTRQATTHIRDQSASVLNTDFGLKHGTCWQEIVDTGNSQSAD